jgi:mannose-6-phosphate isomerase
MRTAALSGEIEHLLEWFPVEAGDTIFAPANTVHALGAGLALVEIQQNSDTTYRLWDYGRGRELHLDAGIEVSDGGPAKFRPMKNGARVECEYFSVDEIRADAQAVLSTGSRERLFICIEGSGTIAGEPYRAGEVWRLDANAEECDLRPAAPSRFLRAGVPERQ